MRKEPSDSGGIIYPQCAGHNSSLWALGGGGRVRRVPAVRRWWWRRCCWWWWRAVIGVEAREEEEEEAFLAGRCLWRALFRRPSWTAAAEGGAAALAWGGRRSWPPKLTHWTGTLINSPGALINPQDLCSTFSYLTCPCHLCPSHLCP